MRVVLAAVLAAAAVAAAGCSGAATPGAAPADAATAAPAGDSAGLGPALLTAADLPLGFQAQDGAGGAGTAALGCAGIDGVYLPAGSAPHAAASFGHSLSSAFVNETITRRPAAAATAAVTAFAAAARSCARFTGPDGTAYTVTAVPVPRWGDGSAALRVRSALAEARPVELAAVRVGDLVVAVAAAGSGAEDGALTRTVVERALAKLRLAGH